MDAKTAVRRGGAFVGQGGLLRMGGHTVKSLRGCNVMKNSTNSVAQVCIAQIPSIVQVAIIVVFLWD